MNILFLLAVGPLAVRAAVKIEAMKHDIQQITDKNFDGVIGKFRESAVSSLWFFENGSKEDQAFLSEYNKVASELKGMAKICAISCTDHPVFCQKQGVKDTPTVMVYPPNPVPAFKYDGKLESKGIASKVARFFPDFSTKLTQENIDSFMTGDPSKPKVLLFSNKKSVPMMWKALSSETVFKRTVEFGFVTDDAKELVDRYKVKKFPTVMMQRGSKGEIKENYKGEVTFWALKDWINLHSESGMGDKIQGGKATAVEQKQEPKPWLVEDVPELTFKSHKDLLSGEGFVVIYLTNGVATADEIARLTGLSRKYSQQLSQRSTQIKWTWLNLAIETEFKGVFKPAEPDHMPTLPSVVVYNPHKRLRFTMLDHEEGVSHGDSASISKLIDKVLAGDARYKLVPGQKLPPFIKREALEAKKTEL